MKLIITESQHKFLFEQFPEPDDKGFESKKPTKVQQKRSNDYEEEGGDWSIINYFDTNPQVRKYLVNKYVEESSKNQ